MKSDNDMGEAALRLTFGKARAAQMEAKEAMPKRGDNAAYGLNMPDHKMPPTKPEEKVPDSGDPDNEADTVATTKKDGKMEDCGDQEEVVSQEKKLGRMQKRMNKADSGYSAHADTQRAAFRRVSAMKGKDPLAAKVGESMANNPVTALIESMGIESMDQYRELAGLQLDEGMHVPEPRKGQTGDVPTGGVSKSNKLKGGLPGLEGTAVQDINPTEGPEGEDHVGDSKETTFDSAIAMLKKEGVEAEALWTLFLEERGLSVDLFTQLMDAAQVSEDVEEMDALLAVEDIFQQWVTDNASTLSENF